MKFIAFSLGVLLLTRTSLEAKDYSENELFEIGRIAIDKRASAKGSDAEKTAFRNALNGLSDAQKIRAIAYRVLAFDKDPKYNMGSSNSAVAAYAIGQDQELITDWSELREMLKKTKDPREFFLISGLIPWSSKEHKHDFVYELTHMLFSDGRVAKDEGEYTKAYANDVSEYAYTAIVSSLRSLEADFEPPPKELPHEEQALILAKWLKEKWPGCENIEIPELLRSEGKRPDKKNQEAVATPLPPAKGSNEVAAPTAMAERAIEKNHWAWVIVGSALLCMFLFVFKPSKGR